MIIHYGKGMFIMAGYATTTYKMTLSVKHPEWLLATQRIYNDVAMFYYALLIKNLDVLKLSNQKAMRELESRTIATKNSPHPEDPIPVTKVPVYCRRAAINAAIGMARSYEASLKNWEKSGVKGKQGGSKPSPAASLRLSPIFYKGMYKGFTGSSILIKQWNGASWVWVKHECFGRKIPLDGKILSPMLLIRKKRFVLSFPVEQVVEDVRNVKERISDAETYCSVSFTASDTLAVCALFNSDGRVIGSHFMRGGKEFTHRRKRLIGRIRKNRALCGSGSRDNGDNRRLWDKSTRLANHWAHLISRRIVDFCTQAGAKFIVVPKYQNLKIHWDFPFLGRKIIACLKYKAWQEGIVVTAMRPIRISSLCSHCGAPLKRYRIKNHNKKYGNGPWFECSDGHRGNAALNAAKNTGEYFYDKYYKGLQSHKIQVA